MRWEKATFSIKYSLPVADIIIIKLETRPGEQYLLGNESVKLAWTAHREKSSVKASIHYWLSQLQAQKLIFSDFNPHPSLAPKQPALFLKQSHLASTTKLQLHLLCWTCWKENTNLFITS